MRSSILVVLAVLFAAPSVPVQDSSPALTYGDLLRAMTDLDLLWLPPAPGEPTPSQVLAITGPSLALISAPHPGRRTIT